MSMDSSTNKPNKKYVTNTGLSSSNQNVVLSENFGLKSADAVASKPVVSLTQPKAAASPNSAAEPGPSSTFTLRTNNSN